MVTFRARGHLVTVTIALALATSALAAGEPQPAPKAVQAAIDCRKLSDNGARLACYDSAVDALGRQLSQGQVIAVDHAQVQQVRRQAFGFTMPSLSLFDRGGKPEEMSEVVLAVDSAQRGADGKWLVRLEGRDPKPGAQATIKKAMLGSYMMMIGGHSPVRVHRDQ